MTVYAGQAAAIARAPVLKDIFPIFRAHPLLFQFLLALVFTFGVSDLAGRLVAVTIGLATVYLVYRLGKLLYGEKAGLLAGLFFALMPYHVIVSRQVLLDGPLVFFTTLTLFFLARYAMTHRPPDHLTGVGCSNLPRRDRYHFAGAIYAFLPLSREIRVQIKQLAVSMLLMAVMILLFPITSWLDERARGKLSCLAALRRPPHSGTLSQHSSRSLVFWSTRAPSFA
jgi:4-amino-4-deoxy-L-arabinose transferase-like glycosyltransferase